MSDMGSPEMSALIRVVRAAIGLDTHEFPNIGKLDREVFHRLAAWHKVLPLAASILAERDAEACERDRWRDVLRRAAAEAERKLAWQAELCNALESAQVPVLSLRGLLLSRALYGIFHARALADIDLLIRPEYAVRAMKILTARGLKPPLPLRPVQQAACARFRTECAFSDAESRCTVDVHWRAMPACFELVTDAAVWKACGRTEWNGYTFWEMAPAHQLLHLCSHGAKHGWDRLVHVVDLAAALQRYPESAIWEAHRMAEQSRRRRLWRFGILLIREMLGMSPPPELIGDLEEDVLRPVAHEVIGYLLDPQVVGARGGRERHGLRVLLANRRDRWDYWRETVLVPSLIELSAVGLPRPLWWGYPVLRVVRLAWRAVMRSANEE